MRQETKGTIIQIKAAARLIQGKIGLIASTDRKVKMAEIVNEVDLSTIKKLARSIEIVTDKILNREVQS